MANGSITKYIAKDNSVTWRLRIDVPDPRTGQRKQKQMTFPTKKEAQAARDEWLSGLRKGTHVEQSRLTFGEYAQGWLERQLGNRPTTTRTYRTIVLLHLIPGLGAMPLQRITRATIERWYAEKLREGGGECTVHLCHIRLRQIMRDAHRDGLVARDEAALTKAPPYTPRKGQAWTVEQARAFLAVAATSPQPAFWQFLLATGARRGEALALRWTDVDWSAGTIRIARQRTRSGAEVYEDEPKTATSTRTIPAAPGLLDALRAQQCRQQEWRAAAGGTWQEGGYVFTRRDGRPLDPGTIDYPWKKLKEAAGVPNIRLHDLRHTAATLWLDAGMDLAVVSQALGHAAISITLDTYRHVVERRRGELATCMHSLLFAPKTHD